jgi:hypothetical protein
VPFGGRAEPDKAQVMAFKARMDVVSSAQLSRIVFFRKKKDFPSHCRAICCHGQLYTNKKANCPRRSKPNGDMLGR